MTGDAYDVLLARLLDELSRDPLVAGVMVQGSVARGDHRTGSDLDLLVLLQDSASKNFDAEVIDSILVERHHGDLANLHRKLEARPALAYGVLDGRILHDPAGGLTLLARHAEALLIAYETSERELRDIHYWLFATRFKLVAALAAGDELKLGFLASTASWKALEGVWAVNHLPMPPGGSVLTHLRDLSTKPEGFGTLIRLLFVGGPHERAEACLTLIDWFLQTATVREKH